MRTLSPLAVTLEFAVEEFAGNRGSVPPRQRQSKRCIYVATLEKAHGIVNSLMEAGRLHEIGLVVVDEVHIIGEVCGPTEYGCDQQNLCAVVKDYGGFRN